MKVSVDRIERVEAPERGRPSTGGIRVVPSVAAELDLRGQRADEALEACDRYIDDAYQAGLPFVRIIHGKGTGALRAAIRDGLADHPLVRRYESGPADAGGDGVTVAVLAGA
jgi:DNA mismatch repair protein MutS2